MDKYLKESRDFWRDRALFLAREAVKDEERHGRALAAREAEVAQTREALIFIVRTYNNGAMTDARLAARMCQAARSALDALAAPPPGDGAGGGED